MLQALSANGDSGLLIRREIRTHRVLMSSSATTARSLLIITIPDHLWHNHEKILLHENDSAGKGSYSPDLIHKAALDFLETNRNKPFFLFYPTTIPHAELFAKEEYMNHFRGKFDPEKVFKGTDSGPAFPAWTIRIAA